MPMVQVVRITINACLELKRKLPKGLQMTMYRSKARKASDQPVTRPVAKCEENGVDRVPPSGMEYRLGGANPERQGWTNIWSLKLKYLALVKILLWA